MSAWKLVEAVPEEPPKEAEPEITTTTRRPSHTSSNRGTSSGRGRGNRSSGDSQRRPRNSNSPNSSSHPKHPGPYRNKADRSYFSYLAVQQIDLIFNPDSLCMDTFVRSYMDEEGYVPLSLLCSYQNVAQYQCTYNDIWNKMKETVSKCKYIEIDEANETVRAKDGWDKYLMPNAYGGRGLPRYMKQPKTTTSSNNNENNAEEGTNTTTEGDNAAAMWLNPMPTFGGYYPADYAYTDPNYYYVDPNSNAYYYNGAFYPNYSVPTTSTEGEVTNEVVENTETEQSEPKPTENTDN